MSSSSSRGNYEKYPDFVLLAAEKLSVFALKVSKDLVIFLSCSESFFSKCSCVLGMQMIFLSSEERADVIDSRLCHLSNEFGLSESSPGEVGYRQERMMVMEEI